MNDALVELFRHKTWATLLLIEACQGVDPATLGATTPGTHGTIQDTLQHLVAADQSYLATVTGEPPAEPLPSGRVPLETLARRDRATGPTLGSPGQRSWRRERELTTRDGWRTRAAVPLAQAIHHAECHRGHVLSVLGAHGVAIPGLDIGEDLDVWHHGIAAGLMQQVTPAPG
ncbi:MAG TPA: DinB family protein [Streptosporangiaceae bacterium]|jgi:uncharacterized damage-inducible protein DinB